MFSAHNFTLWSQGCVSRDVDGLSLLITQNGGCIKHRALRSDHEEGTRNIVLFESLKQLREEVGCAVRTRTVLHQEYVLDSFIYDSVEKKRIQVINKFAFQSLVSRSHKFFSLGDKVDPKLHFYVQRDVLSLLDSINIGAGFEIPLGRCLFDTDRKTPLFLNLYNHSQAGKSTVLSALAEFNPDPKFKMVLCSNEAPTALGSIYAALSLKDRGYGQLGSFVGQTSHTKKIHIAELFQNEEITEGKQIILIFDNLDTLEKAEDVREFFNALKVIREESKRFPFFSAFIGVGVYRSDMVPTVSQSGFKFQPQEVIRFPTYFCFEDILQLSSELTAETGIHLTLEIAIEIFDTSAGHPGFVSFYFSCIHRFLKSLPQQLDLATWRRIRSGKYFCDELERTDIGKKIKSVFTSTKHQEDFDRILTLLLTDVENGYGYNTSDQKESEVVDRLADFGIIRIDPSHKIFFNCDTMRSQIMNRFCQKSSIRGPQFNAAELESMSMFELLKSTLPFLSQLDVPLLTKSYGNQRVPSEYAYQLELNKILSHAGNRVYCVYNESNHFLGTLRADLRIVNGQDLAVLELMSHATEGQFIEHIQRAHHSYSIIRPKHLAVIQFYTDQEYKLSDRILAEIRSKKDIVDVYVVLHDSNFAHLSLEHVLHGPREVLNVKSIVGAMLNKRPLQLSGGQPSKMAKCDEGGKIQFTDMERFFKALKDQGLEEAEIEEIKDKFTKHMLKVKALRMLQKSDLMDMDIKAVGLQLAILGALNFDRS